MKNKIVIPIVLAAGLLLAGAGCSWSSTANTTNGASASSLDQATGTTPPNTTLVPPGCDGCITEHDAGRTIAIKKTSRITIELPEDTYAKDGLTIEPAIMGETFGASAEPGNWVRTFQAEQIGTATIKVPNIQSSSTPFILIVHIVDEDSSTTASSTAWKTYNGLKFSFKYPSDVFTLTTTPTTTVLQSPYYVTENASGIPGNETIHRFALTFSMRPLNLISTIKAGPYSELFSTAFPNNTTSSFTPQPGFSRTVLIGGKTGYGFTVGLEGINTEYIYVPVNNNQTLVIAFSYISDFLKAAIKPQPISEQQQKDIAQNVFDTVKFK